MTWKDVGKFLGGAAPILGTILGGPAGGAVGALIGTALGVESEPSKVLDALKDNPDAIIKIKELESNERVAFQKMLLESETNRLAEETKQIQAVNQTMQAEAQNSANENWWQKGWRPFNGYVVGLASLAAVLFTCYLFYQAIVQKDAAAISNVPALAMAITTILAVPGAAVGITAWHRGVLQREKATGEGK